MTSVDHLADEVLSALVDEELSPAELQAARAHLRTCNFCTDQFDALRNLQGMLRQLPEVDPPRDFSLGPRLIADPPNVIRLQRWYTATRAAAASLAAVFVLLVAGTLYVDTSVAPARQRAAFEVSTSQNTAASGAPAASGAAAANAPVNPSAPAPAAAPTTAPAAAAAPKAAPAAAIARDAGAQPPPAAPAAPAAGAPAPAQADAQSRAASLARTPETTTDLTAAATRVQPLPTRTSVAPAPVSAAAPAVVAPAGVPAALDPAAPLRTAAIVVGLVAILSLLGALVVRHRLGRARAPISVQE